MARLEAIATAANDDDGSRNATAASNGDEQEQEMMSTPIAEDDDLFELDIDRLNRHDDVGGGDHHLRHRAHCAAVADDGHALLANCLLPVSSVSNAVPVAASSIFSSYPYSGYYSSRRLFTGGSRRFHGRPGNSARFCFSSRGFETMGNYFQRY